VNPRGRKRRATGKKVTAKKRPARRRRATATVKKAPARKRRTARRTSAGVPQWVRDKGFTSWASYMESIRGGKTVAKRRRKSSTRKSSTAPRRRRRRSTAVARAKTTRRRYRRNPFGVRTGGLGGIVGIAKQGAMDAVGIIAGEGAARFVRGRAGLEGNTVPAAIVETVTGVAIAVAIRRKFPNAARMVAAGAIAGPMRTAIKSAHIPYVSTALGDEGELPLLGGMYELGTYDQIGSGLGDELGAYGTEANAYA
jgi:hypothetical protein